MILRSRPLLVFSLLATALLVSTDGSSTWLPELLPDSPTPAPAQATAPTAKLAESASPAAEPETRPAQTRVPVKTRPSLNDEIKRIQRDRLACVAEPATSADIFASKSWYVPPPPPKPVPPPPPPPPSAPPLPFSFVGSYQDADGQLVLFLSKGERLYTVSPGDVIDGTYRVEKVIAGQLGLTYLPLNILQSMNVGETS